MNSSAGLLRRLSLFGSMAVSLALSGCGIGTVTTQTGGSLALSGSVQGGVQPITGATIQLMAVGSAGNGSQSTNLLANPVVTDSHSYFSLTGDYSCPSADAQVYLVARGGNPGFTANVNNPALVLLSALGSCGDLIANPNRFISINEVSTVAAVYALSPFMTAYDHVGASATNTIGMRNAFLDAHLLTDTATGRVPLLPSNLSVESGKLYALADAIVPCVNSDGGTACTALFSAATPAGGSAPADTVGALLDIIKQPGHNVAAIFNLIGSIPPYPTTLTAAPHDWTMSLTVTGGGLASPTALGLDQGGNVWVTNYGDPADTAGLVGFSPQGTPLSGSPFGSGLQKDSYGLAVDKNGDVWVTSYDNISAGGTGSVAKFHGNNSSTPGALVGQFYDNTLNYPESIAADPAGTGTILLGNYVGGTVTVYDLNGTYLRNLGSNLSSTLRPKFPVTVTSDGAGGAWVGDQGDTYVVHMLSNGTAVRSDCCSAAQTVALDPVGNLWATNYYPQGRPSVYGISEVGANGAVLIDGQSGGGLYAPGGAAVDAGGQFWVLNYHSSSQATFDTVSEIAGNLTNVAAGTPLSPSTGFGLDAGMRHAYSVAPDSSGNLWVTVRDGNSLRMFFGMATPTATPATPRPQAP